MGEAIVFQYRQSLHLFSAVSQGSGEGHCYSQETGSILGKGAVTARRSEGVSERLPSQKRFRRRLP